jgi:hypothetical protein
MHVIYTRTTFARLKKNIHIFTFHLSYPLKKVLFIHSISIDACHSLYMSREDPATLSRLVVRVSGLGSGIYVFSGCEGKLGEASGLVVVTVEKVVGKADSMVPAASESTLFLLTRTSPSAFFHLSQPSLFLTLPQIHGYQGTKVSLLQK